ncbi:kinase-like domain-containing protein [Rhizophagus irregularis DAOM 181602=DAOM 197198]|nr:kinase-like domain-containing protein [Rhizophagus irregularis DAOM 181602=DAOM 197198]
MDQLSDNTSLGMPTQTTIKHNRKRKTKILCSECNQRRELLEENHHICGVCYKAKLLYIPSGNKVIDDFIMHTLTSSSKLAGKMVFVPYNQFKDVKFIAKGGFSEVYKAIWIDGPLNNSKEITSKALNELKIFHEFYLNWKKKNNYEIYNQVSKYFGITQEPVTKDIMIIMPYYKSGDLINYLTNDFYSIEWHKCWNSGPNKRPEATDIYNRISRMGSKCEIKKSSEIGPVTTNNPGAIYRSRPLSGIIQSAMFTMSTRSLRSESITAEVDLFHCHQKNDITFNDKRKFDDNQIENSFNGDKIIKKIKLIENENNDYITQEFELDIDINSEQCIIDKSYITQEIDFDI